jgi:TonB family protein
MIFVVALHATSIFALARLYGHFPGAAAYEVNRNSRAAIATPSLRPDNPVSLTPYIAQAALLPGEGATVVLKIEVLANGEPGRIDIDTTSGSRQVDQAAIDYARQQRWYAGRVGDVPQPMWIRWGVRLQA